MQAENVPEILDGGGFVVATFPELGFNYVACCVEIVGAAYTPDACRTVACVKLLCPKTLPRSLFGYDVLRSAWIVSAWIGDK